MNIELGRQLVKYQQRSSPEFALKSDLSSHSNAVIKHDKLLTELDELRTKCKELESINDGLKQHFITLRSVFTELATNEGDRSAIKSLPVSCDPMEIQEAFNTSLIKDSPTNQEEKPSVSEMKNCQDVQHSLTDQTAEHVHKAVDHFEVWYNS